MRSVSLLLFLGVNGVFTISGMSTYGQEAKPAEPRSTETNPPQELSRELRLANYLNGAKFVGSFIVDRTGPSKFLWRIGLRSRRGTGFGWLSFLAISIHPRDCKNAIDP